MKKLMLLLSLSMLISCGKEEATVSGLTIKGSSTSAGFAPLAANAGSPTSWKTTFYKAYVSLNEDCSSPVLLQDYGASGREFDMAASPTLFTGLPANGTYKCIMLKFKDVMKFKADAAAVLAWPTACTNTTTEFSFDIFRSGEAAWKNLEGGTTTATGTVASPGEDQVWLYASTNTAAIPGVSVNQTIDLTSPMVVPGNITYYWDARNGLNINNGGGATDYCWVEGVSMGFR